MCHIPATPPGVARYLAAHLGIADHPDREQRLEPRQLREFPKTSAATAIPPTGPVHIYGATTPPFSGFSLDITTPTGKVTHLWFHDDEITMI
jgi:hypothetical protein